MELSSYGLGVRINIIHHGSPLRELTKEHKVFVERNSRFVTAVA